MGTAVNIAIPDDTGRQCHGGTAVIGECGSTLDRVASVKYGDATRCNFLVRHVENSDAISK